MNNIFEQFKKIPTIYKIYILLFLLGSLWSANFNPFLWYIVVRMVIGTIALVVTFINILWESSR
jgi:hypothetical protein